MRRRFSPVGADFARPISDPALKAMKVVAKIIAGIVSLALICPALIAVSVMTEGKIANPAGIGAEDWIIAIVTFIIAVFLIPAAIYYVLLGIYRTFARLLR